MNKATMLFFTLLATMFTHTLQAQEEIEIIEITKETTPEDLPFALIERVPIYPGCSGQDNKALKNCMSKKISLFVNRKLNLNKATKGLNAGTYKIFVSFKIDKSGRITNVTSRGPNKKIEKESIKTIKKLPKMIPGQQEGKDVGVLYSLPITFKVEGNTKEE